MKRKITILLTFAAIAVHLVSCSGSTDDTDTNTADTTAASETTETVSEDLFVKDDLPEINFKGETFSILVGDVHGGTTIPTYIIEETTGDIVDDAVFERNAAVEDRLNIELNWNTLKFEYGTRTDWVTRITTAVMSGDDVDLICGPGYYTTNLVTEKLFIDMYDMPYLDFEKPWWSDIYIENASINDKIYFILGDFSLNKLQLAYCMYFNKEKFDALNIEYPYKTVTDGSWTLDALAELIKDSYHDVNGNSSADIEDTYGLVGENFNQLWAFMDPTGVKVFDRDADGNISFVMDSEHNSTAVDKLRDLWNGNENVFHHNAVSDSNDVSESMFIKGNSYISTGDIMKTSAYRELDFEYGILPYPKFDDNQDNYITRTSSAISIFCIPATASDPDMTAAVLEAMNSETYRSVIPAYYETALKIKYSRDNETTQVLDIIRESISMQFIDIYSSVFSGYSEIFKKTLWENKSTWASDVAGIKDAAEKKLDELISYFE